MKGGRLDRHIVVERVTTSINDIGDVAETWVTFAPLRAELVQNSAKDFLLSGDEAHATRNLYLFRTRWVDGATLDDRVSYAGEPFRLLEIKEIGRRRGLELRCERIGK